MTLGMSVAEEAKRKASELPEDERGQSVAARKHQVQLPVRSLLKDVDVISALPADDLCISQVTYDSRKVQPGALFVAIQGIATNGNLFAKDAAVRGASVILSADQKPADWSGNAVWVEVREPRKALAITAANFYNRPASALKLVGITGTNGKTTISSLIDSIIKASGAKTGLFGTIAYHTPLGQYPAPNTTPESVELQEFFAEVRDAEGMYSVLEASSHALALDR